MWKEFGLMEGARGGTGGRSIWYMEERDSARMHERRARAVMELVECFDRVDGVYFRMGVMHLK